MMTLGPIPRPQIVSGNTLTPPWQSWLNSLARVIQFINQGSYTVSTLPPAATAGSGARAYVTDANATTFASVVAGGGANAVPVYSDGTNWRIG